MDELLIVRPATAADCKEIHRIQVAAVRDLPPGTQDQQGVERWLDAREPSVYAEQMLSELLVVAEEYGELVGWAALDAAKHQITNVFVDPPHHRRGIGTALLSVLEDAARQAGLASVQLQATGSAIDFYLASGYQPDPPVSPGAQWALMKKPL